MNGDGTARQRAAKTRLLDLPHSFTNGDSVVFGDHPFRLYREHPIQIRPAGTPEGTPSLFGPHRELAVEYSDIALAQKLVSPFQCADAGQPKFLWQTPLPGSEVPLRTPASLWRIRRGE